MYGDHVKTSRFWWSRLIYKYVPVDEAPIHCHNIYTQSHKATTPETRGDSNEPVTEATESEMELRTTEKILKEAHTSDYNHFRLTGCNFHLLNYSTKLLRKCKLIFCDYRRKCWISDRDTIAILTVEKIVQMQNKKFLLQRCNTRSPFLFFLVCHSVSPFSHLHAPSWNTNPTNGNYDGGTVFVND